MKYESELIKEIVEVEDIKSPLSIINQNVLKHGLKKVKELILNYATMNPNG